MSGSSQRVTLKNIADKCGYTVNTVSRALRNDTRLPADTLSKIQSAANELGYVRNVLASSLRSGKSRIIAAIVDDIQNPYYSSIISRLNLRLKKAGYSLMLLSNQVSPELTEKYIEEELGQEMIDVAIAHAADGIVFFPFLTNRHMVRHMVQNHVPFVQIGREIRDLQADTVRCDDYAGGFLAGTEFVRLGHRRFLYIAGSQNISSQEDRQNGFIDAIAGSGISKQNIRIITSEDMLRSMAEKSVTELLRPIDYTAIFSFNDHMAYPVIHYLRVSGYRIPEDISIIGFDNIHNDVPYALPLSSIANLPDCHFEDNVTELLLSRIKDPFLPARSVIFPVMLFDGGTHGPCKDAQ